MPVPLAAERPVLRAQARVEGAGRGGHSGGVQRAESGRGGNPAESDGEKVRFERAKTCALAARKTEFYDGGEPVRGFHDVWATAIAPETAADEQYGGAGEQGGEKTDESCDDLPVGVKLLASGLGGVDGDERGLGSRKSLPDLP